MSDFALRLAEAVGRGFRIERELGGGGMSRVFLAEDVALARKVVIKVLPPEMAAAVNQDRFRREIQLAARLQHPHVVPLLSANASGDLLWYVMPYIEGESLRAKLARGELPVPEAVRLLREITDALAYAHEQGVVHRDIKPDNVMVSRGHALVTDFGVAKAVSESGSGSSLTSLGVALGTPAYMAPEQASADPNVDHRADLYALGAVGYEMLVGRPPFSAGSPQALLMAQVTQAPDPVTMHRPSVPPALASVIMRCLEKRAADRFQSAAEIIPQLDAALTPSGGTQPTAAAHLTSSGTRAALRQANPIRVTALFIAASVAILAATWFLEWRLGLPSWVLPVAAVLMVIGLPIMLLTAQRERERLHDTGAGMSGGGLRDRLFTWRRALGGGALALAGLAAAAGGFMTLRAMGVGPFATLVSSGVLAERDKLVLADFTNRTSDSTLAPSITEAFRIDLTQSPVLRVAEGNEVTATLRLMGRDPGLPLSEEIAHDIAVRVGAKAVLVGEVTPLGSGYVLSARLIGIADSVTLVAERETAADAGALIPAVEALSRKLRERIGESLRTVRAGQPLEQVTTRSLPALRAYSEGSRLVGTGRNSEAIKFLEQAVSLDSNFGMAWRRIGVIWNNRNDPARAVPAIRRAYSLRDQMPPLEAAHVTAFYLLVVEDDLPAATAAYERLLASWPDDLTALNNLGVYYGAAGRYREGAEMYRRALTLRPGTGLYLDNLVQNLIILDQFAAADSLLDGWIASDTSAGGRVSYHRARLAAERGDYERAYAIVDSVSKARPNFRGVATDLYMRQGRYREVAAALDPLASAVVEGVVRGNPAAALRMLDKLQADTRWDSIAPDDPRPYSELAAAFTTTGSMDRAEAILARVARQIPEEVLRRDGMRAYALASITLSRGDGRAALTAFRRAHRLLRCTLCTAFDEGRTFEKLGDPDSAIVRYERFVNGHNVDAENREFFLAAALRRLGELHESKGQRAKALEYYGRFVDLWKNADPEFQPLVSDIRKHMAQLAGEPPRP